jgi:hypothetical protein
MSVSLPMRHALIVSLSRSGGKLLRTLFDGHPECNVFPYEHWNRASKNSIPTERTQAFGELSVDQRVEAAGADQVERKLNRLHAAELVQGVMTAGRGAAAHVSTLAEMYEGLSRAYFSALGRPDDALVVNHCGSLSRFGPDQLDAVYGPGVHLLTIRDPRAVFSSMEGLLDRKFSAKRVLKGKVSASVLERHVRNRETDGGASAYLREFCDSYRTMVACYGANPAVVRMRFEDLVRAPEFTMRRVAAQLGIGWHDTLLEPTQLGGGHAPNTSFARSGGGIHAKAADDWVGHLDPATCRYIEETLEEEMAALGYQRAGASSLILDEAPLLA